MWVGVSPFPTNMFRFHVSFRGCIQNAFYSNMFPLFGDVSNVLKKSDPESKLDYLQVSCDILRCPWFPSVSNGNKTLQQQNMVVGWFSGNCLKKCSNCIISTNSGDTRSFFW